MCSARPSWSGPNLGGDHGLQPGRPAGEGQVTAATERGAAAGVEVEYAAAGRRRSARKGQASGDDGQDRRQGGGGRIQGRASKREEEVTRRTIASASYTHPPQTPPLACCSAAQRRVSAGKAKSGARSGRGTRDTSSIAPSSGDSGRSAVP